MSISARVSIGGEGPGGEAFNCKGAWKTCFLKQQIKYEEFDWAACFEREGEGGGEHVPQLKFSDRRRISSRFR